MAQGLDADQVCAAFVCSARYKQEALIRRKVQRMQTVLNVVKVL